MIHLAENVVLKKRSSLLQKNCKWNKNNFTASFHSGFFISRFATVAVLQRRGKKLGKKSGNAFLKKKQSDST
jgi:hypothetical protein